MWVHIEAFGRRCERNQHREKVAAQIIAEAKKTVGAESAAIFMASVAGSSGDAIPNSIYSDARITEPSPRGAEGTRIPFFRGIREPITPSSFLQTKRRPLKPYSVEAMVRMGHNR